MSIKKFFAAAALTAIAAPAFAQSGITLAQCVAAGGTVVQETNTCQLTAEQLASIESSAVVPAAELGALGPGAAIGGAVLLVAVIASDDDDTTTTTTTTGS